MNITTATSNVIPFDFRGNSIRTVVVDGEPWFVAADACKVLSLTNTTTALLALDEDERSKFNLGRQGEVNIVNESGLYTLILRCRDAVTKGSKPHAFRRWVTAEVLPAIRKTGTYADSSHKMATLVDDVIGVSGTNLINGVIGQKVAVLPVGVQRQAKHKLHAILHTRFNVPRTELIPAGKLDVACEYLAAYALEGEWLGKAQDVSPRPKSLQRVMLYWDHEGVERRKEIPMGAYVMTKEEFLRALLVDGDMLITTDEMFEFATLAMANLRGRSQYATQQLQELRRKATAA